MAPIPVSTTLWGVENPIFHDCRVVKVIFYSKFCLTKFKTNFAGSIFHILMKFSRKQSILLFGKLSEDEFDIRYFFTRLKLGGVILC